MAPRRIHITGGPGSGKTTTALRLGAVLNLPAHDLDGICLELIASQPKPLDVPFCIELLRDKMAALASQESWVSEGSYLDWTEDLVERAELIIWLQVPWRIASYRILSRHLKATLARNNRFPGWRRLYRFWRWSSRYYSNRNPHGLNDYGNPNTLETLAHGLAGHAEKLRPCRNWQQATLVAQEAGTGRTRS